MDGRFRTRLCRARRLNRSWSLPTEATGRAYRLGCRSRRFQPVFGVYDFVDEKPAQCTIRRHNCTFGRFFVRGIAHIEAFMSMDDAMRARGHCSRSDSDVTDKGLRSALPSTPLAGAETDAIGSCAPRTAFPCPSVPPHAAAWSQLAHLATGTFGTHCLGWVSFGPHLPRIRAVDGTFGTHCQGWVPFGPHLPRNRAANGTFGTHWQRWVSFGPPWPWFCLLNGTFGTH